MMTDAFVHAARGSLAALVSGQANSNEPVAPSGVTNRNGVLPEA